MRDITAELKELCLHGMAGAWEELTTHEGRQTDVRVQASRWLIEHLRQAEHAQRAFASAYHRMKAAKIPLHHDLAGFDFEASKVDKKLECRIIRLMVANANTGVERKTFRVTYWDFCFGFNRWPVTLMDP